MSNWSVINGTQTNKWYTGTATFNTGANSAYISNDAGANNAYSTSSSSVSHIYRDITFPTGNPIDFSFNWKGVGEGGSNYDYDNLKIFIVPTTLTPQASTSISNIYRIGANWYNNSTTWQNVSFTLPDSLLGNTYRLVVTWINDGSDGEQPPIAIDDISLIQQACGTPSGLHVSNITSTSANISWNSIETSFSIEYKKTADATWNTVTDNASPYALSSLDANTSYDVRVRSFCDPSYSNYSSTITFMTNCTAVNIPISENIDAVTVPAIPDCWRKVIQTTSTGNDYNNYYINSTFWIKSLINVK